MSHATGLAPDVREMVLETLQEVLRRHLPEERILDLDARDAFPEDVVKELFSPDVGMHLLFLPEEVGGLGGGTADVCRVSEVMASVDLGVATAFLATFLGTEPLLFGGTPEQQEIWLGRVAAEGLIVAYGVTEPEAGSNLASLKTTAQPILGADGTVGSYRLNGTKQFITNGGVADLYTILARAPQGPTFFVVERGTPGFSSGRHEEKHGIRASNTTSVILEDVVVPAANLIGGVEGQGLRQASAVFGHTRLMVGSFGLGAGQNALDRAVRYGRQRIQFGGPLIEKEGYALKLLVPHAVALAAGRAYLEEIAARLDEEGTDLPIEGAIAKYWCTEAGNRAADAALQAHGGYGYMREYMVEKIRRDVRITNIYEGTSEILQSVIGMNRWKDHVRSKGAFYAGRAEALEVLHEENDAIGADTVAKAARGLGDILSYAQQHRLPRHQIVLFALADLVTVVEVAAAFCRKAACEARSGDASARLTGIMSRILGREALTEMSRIGRLCAVGFTDRADEWAVETARPLMDRLAPGEALQTMTGHWLDMSQVAAHLASDHPA
ncbi:MAG: acyl-CoA dehydrogenase family protein [Planctomycetota bacterium]